jgi:ethanolamine ammonia-lyase small subunit
LPEITEALRDATPARILASRAGTRPTTAELLRFQVDHACARDAVRTLVDHELPSRLDCVLELHSAARDKTEYLLDPGVGRKLRIGEDERLIAELPRAPQVLVAIGDGLSSAAVETQVPILLPALLDCLRAEGFESIAGPVYIHLARVDEDGSRDG